MKIDEPWVNFIKATGAVGVVGFLFASLMEYLFSNQIIELFGSDRVFYLTVLIVCFLFIALMAALLKRKDSDKNSSVEPKSKTIQVNYDGSTHNGDNNF